MENLLATARSSVAFPDRHQNNLSCRISVINPYEPSAESGVAFPTNLIRQRSIALTFISCGIVSWASLFYAIKDIQLQADPGYQQPVHYAGLWSCGLFGWLTAILGLFGIYTAISRQWHPWKVSLAYLIAGLFLCYAGAFVTTLFVIGDTI